MIPHVFGRFILNLYRISFSRSKFWNWLYLFICNLVVFSIPVKVQFNNVYRRNNIVFFNCTLNEVFVEHISQFLNWIKVNKLSSWGILQSNWRKKEAILRVHHIFQPHFDSMHLQSRLD